MRRRRFQKIKDHPHECVVESALLKSRRANRFRKRGQCSSVEGENPQTVMANGISSRKEKTKVIRSKLVRMAALSTIAIMSITALVALANKFPAGSPSGVFGSAADAPQKVPTVIERLDPALDAMVPAGAALEKVATGFTWTEGP